MLDQKRIYCNFETGHDTQVYSRQCRMEIVSSNEVSDVWEKVKGLDNTFGTASGNIILVMH